MYNLNGKVALVTGAGGEQGIGRAICQRLAKEGCNLVVNDLHAQPYAESGWGGLPALVAEIEATGQQAFAVAADVSNADQVSNMIQQAIERFGHIDILVNNAGIIDDGLLVRMSDEAWERVIATNLNGTFYCTRAALRTMLRRRWGRIINIGSVVGLRGNPGQTNYTASKAGIIGFAKALAKEVATRNITVNTVAPGYLETETTAVLTDDQKAYWLSVIPQGHFGEVDDIAHLVAFLASDKAKYITGQVISVDGGMAV